MELCNHITFFFYTEKEEVLLYVKNRTLYTIKLGHVLIVLGKLGALPVCAGEVNGQNQTEKNNCAGSKQYQSSFPCQQELA